MEKKIYHVSGMHCEACEILITQKLKTLPFVSDVLVSLPKERVTVYFKAGQSYSRAQLQEALGDLAYELQEIDSAVLDNAEKNGTRTPLFYIEPGTRGVKFDYKAFFKRCEWVIIVLSCIVGWKIISYFEQSGNRTDADTQTLFGILLLGLVASISSCAILVGGLLMTLTKVWREQYAHDTKQKRIFPHIQFHVGRIGGFVLFGAMFGLLGDFITFDSVRVYAVLVLGVSLIMAITAFKMLGIKWFHTFRMPMGKKIALQTNRYTQKFPWLVGAGTFFFPCGFTLIAQSIALASGSFLRGAVVMGIFALGTFPVLLGISVFGIQMTANQKRMKYFNKYVGIAILLFSVKSINGQMNVLGLPSIDDIGSSTQTGSDVSLIDTVLINGEQQVHIRASGFSYIPVSSMTIQQGIPTKLIVDDEGIQGCGAFLTVVGLIDGYVSLEMGKNEINLGTPSPGTYKITCSMGMVPPVTLRVI